MKWTDKEMKKAFGNIEDHNYKHYNTALGMKIEGKEHFRQVLERNNQIPYEKACENADRNRERNKFSGVSEEAKRKMYDLKRRADKNGQIKWSDGVIRQMKDAGVDYTAFTKQPKHFNVNTDGGFR